MQRTYPCESFHCAVFAFTPRTAKMEARGERRSRQKMGRRKKKEEKNKKAREKGTRRTQRWVENGWKGRGMKHSRQKMKY